MKLGSWASALAAALFDDDSLRGAVWEAASLPSLDGTKVLESITRGDGRIDMTKAYRITVRVRLPEIAQYRGHRTSIIQTIDFSTSADTCDRGLQEA